MTNKQFKEELKREVEIALRKLDADEILNHIPEEDRKGKWYAGGTMTKNNYANLIALSKFARNHPELTGKQIEYFIKGKESFKFLNKFISVLPDAVEELRFHGMISCIMSYKSELRYKRWVKDEKTALKNIYGTTYGITK